MTTDTSYQTATVQSVNSEIGLITLQSPPSTNIKKVTCDYSYYDIRQVDREMVEWATILYTGYLYCLSEYGLIPEQVSIGTLRKRYAPRVTRGLEVGGLPYRRYYQEWRRLMNIIRHAPWERVKAEEVKVQLRKTLEEMALEEDIDQT